MKKLLTLLLVAGMFSIYSCGSGSEQKEGESTAPATEQAAPAAEQPAAPADSAAAPAEQPK